MEGGLWAGFPWGSPLLGLIDWERDAVAYWGDADQDYDFTTTDDTAAYVAAAALDDDAPDGAFEIVDDVFVQPYELEHFGSLCCGLEKTLLLTTVAGPRNHFQPR